MDVTERNGSSTVRLNGELDFRTSPDLRQRLLDLIQDDEPSLVIDLRQLDFIDSTGLGVLVGALKNARQKGGDIVLSAPRAAIRNALEITGLTQVFQIADEAQSV